MAIYTSSHFPPILPQPLQPLHHNFASSFLLLIAQYVQLVEPWVWDHRLEHGKSRNHTLKEE